MRACTSCEFAQVVVGEDGPRIDCHRYPPSFVNDVDGEPMRVWPQVGEGDWCGEFVPTSAVRVAELPQPAAPSIDLLDS